MKQIYRSSVRQDLVPSLYICAEPQKIRLIR